MHIEPAKQGDEHTRHVSVADPRPRRPQRQQHRDKLSSIGARIARVAHELNVPAGLVAGSLDNLDQYVGALVRYVRASEAHLSNSQELARLRAELQLDYVIVHAPELLRICRDGTQRLTHAVQQLKGYTRRAVETDSPGTVDLATVVDGAIALAAHGRQVIPTVHRDLPHQLCVRGIGDSLSQAFINVIGNAFDAVAQISDPQVWISARVTGSTAQKGQPAWVEVRIRDNGPGIHGADRGRIFEAFFTTKSRGSGLGLGLAIAREILERLDGTIELAEPGDSGAEFVIRLPIATSA